MCFLFFYFIYFIFFMFYFFSHPHDDRDWAFFIPEKHVFDQKYTNTCPFLKTHISLKSARSELPNDISIKKNRAVFNIPVVETQFYGRQQQRVLPYIYMPMPSTAAYRKPLVTKKKEIVVFF
jgi:hypothetical protein